MLLQKLGWWDLAGGDNSNTVRVMQHPPDVPSEREVKEKRELKHPGRTPHLHNPTHPLTAS